MPYIFNATNETVNVQAQGNWFSFKPKQIKGIINPNVAFFLATERADQGLVALPDEFEDLDYRNTPEAKAILKEKEEQGINNFIAALERRVYNNQVSLRQDLEKANQKIDPAALATAGELEAMRKLKEYKSKANESSQKQMAEVAELMKDIGKLSGKI